MNTYANELGQNLSKVIELIAKVSRGELPIEKFISSYDNFYYYWALDGHEADENQLVTLNKFHNVIVFLEEVQLNVINAIYVGNDLSKFKDVSNRISLEEALPKIQNICNQHNIDMLINSLAKDSLP